MYSQIASRFDKTRAYVWPCVREFLKDNYTEQATLLEEGCGNGKNMLYAKELGYLVKGYDICPEFVEICKKKGLDVEEGNILDKRITENYDIILCIAVLHHLGTEDERVKAISNLYDQLKKGGKILITMWSYETEYDGMKSTIEKKFTKGENSVPWFSKEGIHITDRYYYIYDEASLKTLLMKKEFGKLTIHWEQQNWIVVIEK